MPQMAVRIEKVYSFITSYALSREIATTAYAAAHLRFRYDGLVRQRLPVIVVRNDVLKNKPQARIKVLAACVLLIFTLKILQI